MNAALLIVLTSLQDASVNFVFPAGVSVQESRYVRRTDDYFIIYLSTHNGCDRACRFCHLTQTGQTTFEESTLADLAAQAKAVFDYYASQVASEKEPPAPRVHINWMARGEPLASSLVLDRWDEVVAMLGPLTQAAGFDIANPEQVSIKISTIAPLELASRGALRFAGPVQPEIYYSLYSLDPAFRRRWLPKAMDPTAALEMLAEWQRACRSAGQAGFVKLHWAFIDGENDSEEQMAAIVRAVEACGLEVAFNAVRYNPFGASQGTESPIERIDQRMAQIMPTMRAPGSRIVPRVGFDVKASCGMFVA